MTKQRELVLKIVQGTDQHLTAEQIFLEAKKEMPAIALATVYNSLNYLTQNHMIVKLSFVGQTDRYDKMFVLHDHMICSRCGRISDVVIDGMQKLLRDQTGEDVRSYELTIHHFCPECRSAEKPSQAPSGNPDNHS